jgi:dihydropteroate synthase
VHHNLALLRHLEKFNVFGCPLLLGVSRKSFIGTLSQQEDAAHRLPGSLAAGLWGVGHGIKILRVHDVHETVQALKVHHAISSLS